jgi:integrase
MNKKAYQRKSGLWEAKGVDPGTGVRKSFYGRTQDDAIRKATGEPLDTLIGYYERCFLPTIRHLAPATIRMRVGHFDRYIAPKLGDTPLESIDRPMLQRFFNGIERSPRTVQMVHGTLSQILGLAERDAMIERNPAKWVRLPKADPLTPKPIEPWQLKDLLTGEQRELALLCGSGLRLGEALACGPGVLKDGWLSIESQVVQNGKGKAVRQNTLKTPASKRRIPFKFDMPAKLQWVEGNPPNVSSGLKRHCQRLGFVCTPHMLRHTFITTIEDLECPRRVVAELVGHTRPDTTDGYSKVADEQKEKWMDKYWEFVLESGELRIGRMA